MNYILYYIYRTYAWPIWPALSKKISKPSLINILERRFGGGRLSQWPIWSPSSPNANVLIETDFPTPQICGVADAIEHFLSEPSDLRQGYRICFKLPFLLPPLTKEDTSLSLSASLSHTVFLWLTRSLSGYMCWRPYGQILWRWDLRNLLTH